MPTVNMKGVKATWYKSDLCKERVRYKSKHAALNALKHMQERGLNILLEPIQCKACEGWHLAKREA